MIRVDRGRGMYVASTPIKYPIGERVRYNESLEAQGTKPSYEKLKAIEIPADRAIANALKIEIGTPVILIERIGLANDRPISIGSSYFPSELFPDLIKFWDKYSSISKLLKEIYDRDHSHTSFYYSLRSYCKRSRCPTVKNTCQLPNFVSPINKLQSRWDNCGI